MSSYQTREFDHDGRSDRGRDLVRRAVTGTARSSRSGGAAEIDAALAEEHWATRLRGKMAEREAAAVLIELAISGPEVLVTITERLRHRFPRACTPCASIGTI